MNSRINARDGVIPERRGRDQNPRPGRAIGSPDFQCSEPGLVLAADFAPHSLAVQRSPKDFRVDGIIRRIDSQQVIRSLHGGVLVIPDLASRSPILSRTQGQSLAYWFGNQKPNGKSVQFPR